MRMSIVCTLSMTIIWKYQENMILQGRGTSKWEDTELMNGSGASCTAHVYYYLEEQ